MMVTILWHSFNTQDYDFILDVVWEFGLQSAANKIATIHRDDGCLAFRW